MSEQSDAPSAETAFSIWRDTRRARKQGPEAIAERQRRRLAEMIRYARRHSAYYEELYRGLPEGIDNPASLPVTSKKPLMARFDDWVTDPAVTHRDVRAFVDDPTKIGERFLGKYTVATTSGTTGVPGIFLMDDRSMSVTSALAAGMLMSWLRLRDVLRIAVRRGRMSMIMASGGHYASTVAAARLQKSRGERLQVLSSHMPIHEMVDRLNEFQPALLAPYASVASLLATEQEAGRLRIKPALMALSAEGLAPAEYDRIAEAFEATVGNSYASTECPFLSYGCEERWLHVNADWVAFEPVDADYRPTPVGEPSHTVLISNLANRIQPILRYDLGDSVLVRPDPCPCGNPLPAIRVQGRAGDVLRLTTADGRDVAIPPLALDLDDVSGVELFQIAQTSATALEVRLSLSPGADRNATWETVRSRLADVLAGYDLANVTVALADRFPEKTPGGKHRAVIPL
jgi:phenylacetate-coenzyme A ligase PaaK-like adenylate-forming protein